jgi:O-antigen ligase
MARVLKNNKINNIEPRDHLHNEFLDILLKFGISSLILLLLIYYLIVRTGHIKHSVLLNILIIMLLASQLTQSQFAHHQAITFFITLFFILQRKIDT